MSWEATSYVKRLRETPRGRVFTRTEKLLLMVLADYHNAEEWMAWPTVAALAEDCLSSRQWVMKVLAGLVADGVLAVCAPPAYVAAGQHWARRAYAFVGLDRSPTKVVNPVDRLPAAKAVNFSAEGGQLSVGKAVNSGVAGKEEPYQPPLQPPEEQKHHPAEGGDIAPQERGAGDAAAAPPDDSPGHGNGTVPANGDAAGEDSVAAVCALWREFRGPPRSADRREAAALAKTYPLAVIELGIVRSVVLAPRPPQSLAYCRGAIEEAAGVELGAEALRAAIASARRALARGWTRRELGPGMALPAKPP